MKQLILLSGPMGVGKTTAARGLLDVMPRSVMLDGDWCWEQGNHWDFCDRNKEMVMDNICYLLGNFLSNPRFETVIFSWVMQLPEIHAELLARLEDYDFDLFNISLICDEATLRQRVADRGGDPERSAAYLALYSQLDTVKLDVSGLSPDRVVTALLGILNADAPRCIF